jgi:hypothetical protein
MLPVLQFTRSGDGERMIESVRHQVAFQETMKRLHGEIERMLYAAEIACPFKKVPYCDAKDCAFIQRHGHSCTVQRMRNLIGDHFEQHDCMRECPR